jgi:hypothetical protein
MAAASWTSIAEIHNCALLLISNNQGNMAMAQVINLTEIDYYSL